MGRTMKYHLRVVRMAIIKNKTQQKKPTNNKCWRGCGEKGTLLYCWLECNLAELLWRTAWQFLSFLKKVKLELSYDPAIPLLGIYPEKTIIQKDTCTPMFIAALFTITRTWTQPKCPSAEEWIKMWYSYTMEYYSAIKMTCANLDEPRDHHTERSKSDTEGWISYDTTYMQSLKIG